MIPLSISFNKSKYPLFIGTDILPKLGELVQLYRFGSSAILIIDRKLKGGYVNTLVESFAKVNIPLVGVFIRGGEKSKNLPTVHKICQKLVDNTFDIVIAFGGGVTADVAGFVSNIFNNDLKYIQIPSSLTAQINSSISDRAFLNIGTHKNVLSVEYKLNLVLCDIGLLRSLPANDLILGLGHILRYSLIEGTNLFYFLEQHIEELQNINLDLLEDVVRKCCETKLKQLSSTPSYFPSSEIMNFGSFIATSLEEITNSNTFKPGETLIWGMLIESIAASDAGIFKKDDFERFFNLLKRIKLKHKISEINISLLIDRIDAKLPNYKLILPKQIGELTIVENFDKNLLFNSIKILKMRN